MKVTKMKKIRIISVGTLSPEFKKLFQHYEQRITHFYSINCVETKEFSEEKNIETKKLKETNLVLSKIPKNSTIILCSLRGKLYSSVEISEFIKLNDDITFIIGGSDGLCEELINSKYKISFSNMTFPHQLFRIMLAEQIYRSATIIANKKYHK
ncbi:50S rRNA methyltransferase [Mycoplasmopsis californica HAZ160_1]|nr:50S rRNA methyltransferase [Mycoplasmopsis californica HAZ160_1]BBG41189.1 50S rRNA methyltransferase [Mycoplasmopsis californica]BBG41782.1 50S rRNA methyltransferase [Mycoplasmopsis californica]BBG42376.1 50S rRNA methyltransferase [Mycoplasmopsis californica]BBG42951.1 50S rRNA methyltransferase [Mycoplasmopsis californica]